MKDFTLISDSAVGHLPIKGNRKKNTKPKTKSFGYQILGFGSGGVSAAFVAASGGTESTSGNFKIHKFTGPGTFCVSAVGNAAGSTTVDYIVVASGGGGGGSNIGVGQSSRGSGGGGAGGYRESSGAASGCYTRTTLGACVSALPVSVQGYPITVGGAGAAGSGGAGGSGNNSVFSSITSAGGGGGRSGDGTGAAGAHGIAGGSGGGLGSTGPIERDPGAGNTPPVSPPQGNPGGGPRTAGDHAGGTGGGGATQAGPTAVDTVGDGAVNHITGSPVTYAQGGMGGSWAYCTPYPISPGAETAGPANSGWGGGGGQTGSGAQHSWSGTAGAAGGSGVVIIRYKYQ